MFRLAIHGKRDYTGRMEWNDRFMQVFTEAVYRYHEQQPRMTADYFFLPEERALLASMGYTPYEMYDYVQDYATLGEPSPSTVLLIAAARRAFFKGVQRGYAGNAAPLKEVELPRETDALLDIPYLPRIIRKAEAKLHGTLPRNVMYYCAKDRAFLRSHGGIHPADFLYAVWNANTDKQKVVNYVLREMKSKGELPVQPVTPSAEASEKS